MSILFTGINIFLGESRKVLLTWEKQVLF